MTVCSNRIPISVFPLQIFTQTLPNLSFPIPKQTWFAGGELGGENHFAPTVSELILQLRMLTLES